MRGRIAAFSFLAVCIVLAILLLTHLITPIVSGGIFAAALAILGGMSSGFRRR